MTAPLASPAEFDFRLPPGLEASAPPESRGLSRDQVRLLVSRGVEGLLEHARFDEIDRFLSSGDLLVVNTSATINAALRARRSDGTELELHVSRGTNDGSWIVELRTPTPSGSEPYRSAEARDVIDLPDGATADLLSPVGGSRRLWRAGLRLNEPWENYLERNGFPIRYGYVPETWPLNCYQTVFATEPGSAEMPSAGRAFSDRLVTRLVARGVQFAPILLHTGVASLEDHEPPYPEFYRVPAATARAVDAAKQAGSRVIAVGTTVVRALETVADRSGRPQPAEGWTDLIVTADRPMRIVDGLLTGFHEPRATHLAMLRSLVGNVQLRRIYAEAIDHGYLWHEFGDLNLLLP